MTIGKPKLCKTACVLHWPITGSMWCSKGSGFWALENSKFAELLGVIVQMFNEFVQKHKWKVFTLPQINIAPEHVRLKDYFPFGARPIFRYYVSTMLVSGRVGRSVFESFLWGFCWIPGVPAGRFWLHGDQTRYNCQRPKNCCCKRCCWIQWC